MNISTLFNQDVELLNNLVLLLSREQEALINMDIDQIEDLLDQKGVLLQRISTSVKNRHDALAKVGFDADENGMASWIKSNRLEKELQLWQGFQQNLEQAKELNRLNGQMINKHFNRNQQSLGQLQGKPATSGVYGPNGHTASNSYSRTALAV